MSSEPVFPDITVSTKPKEQEKSKTRRFPPYNVILENDDDHTFEFVMDVLRKVFGYPEEKAYLLTNQAHNSGRAVVWTGPKEVAELKVEQIRSFHEIHPHDSRKLGPVGCTIEPAPGG